VPRLTLITKPIICYVTDRISLNVPASANREGALLQRIRSAAAAGVDWIELREKDLESRPLLDLTREALIAARTGRGAGSLVLVNDRLDVAAAAGADGVHLTEASMPVSAVAQWKREEIYDRTRDWTNLLVGASCHSREGGAQAEGDGTDYIFFGPVFATASKAAFGAPQGLAKLAEVCRAVKIPVLAIGGVTVENAPSCMEAGASGIAAIGLFQRAEDLSGLLSDLRDKL
jgi:thiamine-phosphate pyrophosphorylase